MSNKQVVIDSIVRQRMLPLFFAKDEHISIQITRTLYSAGVRVLEYTNRGETALNNFSAIKKVQLHEMPDLWLGAGTVKSAEEATAFIEAGADFLVSPIINPAVGQIAMKNALLWIPGCFTPTEIYCAQQHGAAIIKIFPAQVAGPQFISSIKEVFSGQKFIPTGGVELNMENIKSWFNAGVCAVGIGSKLISKQILSEQLYNDLFDATVDALALMQTAASNI